MKIESKLMNQNIKEEVITTNNGIVYKIFIYNYNISKIKIWRIEGAKEKLLFDAPINNVSLMKARIIYQKILNNEFDKEVRRYDRQRESRVEQTI